MDFRDFSTIGVFPTEMEFQTLIRFFLEIRIAVNDITTEPERENHQKVVEVKYTFGNRHFITKPLYYKNIEHSPSVENPQRHVSYFGANVFWLDIEKHDWPRPKNETDIDHLIIDDITDNDEFKSFLKLLANNGNSGAIQRISAKGRSNQYYRNLENNNHWHDLVLMIKEAIVNESIRKEFFKPLIFRWNGTSKTERLRVSLWDNFGARSLIWNLVENIKIGKKPLASLINQMEKNNKIIDLLYYKKQIILQGPPGTGKTKWAKEIAQDLIFNNSDVGRLTEGMIRQYMKPGLKFSSAKDMLNYEVEKVNNSGVSVIASTNKVYTPTFKDIIDAYNRKVWEVAGFIKNGNDSYSAGIAKCIHTLESQNGNFLKNSKEFKLIQFHPSYTYEDFVRGIEAKPNPESGESVFYEAVNKPLGKFAKDALDNYNLSQAKETKNSIVKNFDSFLSYVLEQIDINEKYMISEKVYIFYADDRRFKYKGDNWTAHPNGLNMNYSELQKIVASGLQSRQDINKSKTLNALTRQHATYFQNVIELFREYINKIPLEISEKTALKNYVLIIDEINRANLSSVLGELIYALEYRGELVDSMYEVEEDGEKSNKLLLPPNLYIIGTMNTADRSVGHIDYAIRRRFAFVDVLPDKLENREDLVFHSDLFKKVAELFISNYDNYLLDRSTPLERADYLSAEFEAKDVWLGHSYFIQKRNKETQLLEPENFNIRVKYEIVPILREYVKDGVLNENAIKSIDEIEKIHSSF